MNFAVAVWPPTSVTVTVVPDVPRGTANVQLKDPVPPVVKEPLVQLVIVLESRISDFSAVDTEKPVPDTVTIEPTGPRVGLTLIAGVFTAVNVIAGFTLAPLTVTVPDDGLDVYPPTGPTVKL